MSATGRVPSEEEVILKSIGDLLEKRDPRRKIARSKRRAEKKITAEILSGMTPELPKESDDEPMMASATKWEENDQMTAGARWEANVQMASSPKWEENQQIASVPKEIVVLKPRGRKGIPVAIVQQVWQRDDYCCVNELPDGSRCASKIGLQVDHIRPVAFGQDNRLENLRLLCRQCNIAAAEELLGGVVMDRYRWLKSRVYGEAREGSLS